MGYAVYLDRLAFQKVDATTGLPDGEPEIVNRGQQVPGYVRPFELAALSSAGAIVNLGDPRDEGDDTPRFAEIPPALPNPEVPQTVAGNPVLHSFDSSPEGWEARDGVSVPAGSSEADERVAEEPAGEPARPGPRDSKQAWEDYAVSRGMDRGEAESMNKQELITAVESREGGSA